MFYEDPSWSKEEPAAKPVSALFCLTPSESKRLIARAVARLPEVKAALSQGLVVIARGTTNAFVAEEILGIRLEAKARYAAGFISGELSVNAPQVRLRPIVLKKGQPAEMSPAEALKEFTASDVFIKGANAVDAQGHAGILVAGETGGTIGEALPIILSLGAHLIVPVGLEKLIPSVITASAQCGISRFKYASGLPTGLSPLVTAQVVTEIQAFRVLAGVRATHVASGGIGGGEGSVVLALEGSEEEIDKALEAMKHVKGEPSLSPPITPASTTERDNVVYPK
ncbi:MAG: hypothetical protein AAB037_03930 [Chloroflexota bacterium]